MYNATLSSAIWRGISHPLVWFYLAHKSVDWAGNYIQTLMELNSDFTEEELRRCEFESTIEGIVFKYYGIFYCLDFSCIREEEQTHNWMEEGF